MTAMRIVGTVLLIIFLGLLAAPAANAHAWSGCYGYITVQPGDTLQAIATACSTTVDAIRAANPSLGATLDGVTGIYMPVGGADLTATPAATQSGTSLYMAQAGDTLGGIALLYDTTLSQLMALNPGITNPNSLQVGQLIVVPATGSSAYTPPTVSPSSTTFPASGYSQPFGNLMVSYGHGLLVRTGPGIQYPEIKSQYVSAVKFSHWQYRKGSLTTDNIGFVWVEVKLSPLYTGQSTGWILVRDSLGEYFTAPYLGPKIDPNDP